MKMKFFMLAAIITSSQTYAQQDSTKLLNEVIITTNKFSQKQDQTGKVISVITKEDLAKKAGSTLTQVLNEQAGITINGALNNAGTNQTLYVRGAASGRTLVLLDGIPVYDPSFINAEFDLNLLSINDIDRIEISRGAQSTLYGSDAIAGVVNIITTQKDITRPLNAKVSLTGGTYNTFRGNANVYGKAGKLTYSAQAGYLGTKGFSNAYDSSGKQAFDKDGFSGNIARASLQYQFTPGFSVKSFIQNAYYKTDADASVFLDEKDYTIKNNSLMTGAGFAYKNDAVSVNGNYQYSESKRNYLNDSLDIPGFSTYSTDDYYGKTQFAELYAAINLNKNFTLLQGADYRTGSMNEQFFSVSFFGPYYDTLKTRTASQSSLYASLFYKSTNEKLNIELGGRLNVHSAYGSNYTYTFNPSYRINKNFRVFGSIATGFKAPTLYQLYSFSGNPDLKPERSHTYEIGIEQKHSLFRNRLCYFYRDTKDGLDYDNINYVYFNFISQVVRGLEWEASIKPTAKLSLNFNYTFLSPTEVTQSRLTFKDSSYNHLLRRPANSFNISAGYQLTKAAYISINGKYAGKRYDAGGYQADDIELKSYFLLGAYAEYRFNKYLKIFVDAKNITNKKFFDIYGYNSIPFLFNGGVTFNL